MDGVGRMIRSVRVTLPVEVTLPGDLHIALPSYPFVTEPSDEWVADIDVTEDEARIVAIRRLPAAGEGPGVSAKSGKRALTEREPSGEAAGAKTRPSLSASAGRQSESSPNYRRERRHA